MDNTKALEKNKFGTTWVEFRGLATLSLLADKIDLIRQKDSKLISMIPGNYREDFQSFKKDCLNQIFENSECMFYQPMTGCFGELKILSRISAGGDFDEFVINSLNEDIKKGVLKKSFLSPIVSFTDEQWDNLKCIIKIPCLTVISGSHVATLEAAEYFLENTKKEIFYSDTDNVGILNYWKEIIQKKRIAVENPGDIAT